MSAGSATIYWTVYNAIDEHPIGVDGSTRPADAVRFSWPEQAAEHAEVLNGSAKPPKPGQPPHYEVRKHSHEIKSAHRKHGGTS